MSSQKTFLATTIAWVAGATCAVLLTDAEMGAPDSVQSDRASSDQTGSKGAYFLQGRITPGGPYYMPGLKEQYDLLPDQRPSATDDVIAVRRHVAQPGQELVELRYQRIRKGAFERFVQETHDKIWPWEEKLGARPIGQWKVIYPAAPSRTSESPDFDEVITLTRYASHTHWKAMQPEQAVFLGGNGPDWQAWRSAVETQRGLTLQTRTEFMGGVHVLQPACVPAALGGAISDRQIGPAGPAKPDTTYI